MEIRSASSWRHLEEIFLAAADLEGAARRAFLDEKCVGDAALRAEADALLAADNGIGGLTGMVSDAAASLVDEDLIGSQVGAWRVVRMIGQGGMGSVFLGLRADAQFEKRVAIKVIRRGMDSTQLLARFRHERQILAQLNHPYIAQLLDGGSTRDGRPFLVMEYVDGQPLLEYCTERSLNVEDRCRLFCKICEAVAYAHRNLVIHRDLKPGNIMVTPDGAPKLLDFGIAKLISPDNDGGGRTLTIAAERFLSPDYACPEQVRGLHVTTAADIYSLGAILFELLTGARAHRLTSYTLEEVARIVCDTTPERPSSKARHIPRDIDNIVLMAMRKEPERRYASADQFRQDIERHYDGLTVVAREDTFGYRAGKFLLRHRVAVAAAALVAMSLAGGGVMALDEASVARNQRAIAERERDTARSAQLTAEREHGTAVRERDRAESKSAEAVAERAKAEKNLQELVGLANKTLLDIHDQLERLPGATEARRAIVGTTLDYLNGLLAEAGSNRDLELAVASGYLKMGDVLGSPLNPNLGDTAGAVRSYQQAIGVLERIRAANPADPDIALRWIIAMKHVGNVHQEAGKIADGVAVYDRAMRQVERLAARYPERPDVLNEQADLNVEYARSESKLNAGKSVLYAKRGVEIREKLVARFPDNEEYAQNLASDYGTLSLALNTGGDQEAALEIARKSIPMRERNLARHPDDVLLKRDLMMGYGRVGDMSGGIFFTSNAGDDKAAFESYRKALDVAESIVKADPNNQLAQTDVATALMRTGSVLPAPDAIAASLGYLLRAHTIFTAALARDPSVRATRGSLALTGEYIGRRYLALDDLPASIEWSSRSLAISQDMVKAEPAFASARIDVMSTWPLLLQALAKKGNREEALRGAREAIGTALEYAAHGPRPARMALFPPQAYGWLGDVYAALAAQTGKPAPDWAEAERAYELSRSGWNAIAKDAPKEAPRRLAELDAKLAQCGTALRAAR